MRNRLCCIASTLLILSATYGCGSAPGPVSTPAPAASAAAPKVVTGTTLPDRVDGLQGVTFVAPEIETTLGKDAPAPGAYFLLVSPTDPTKGVLVCVGSLKSEELAQKKGPLTVKGPVKKFKSDALKKWIEKNKLTVAAAGDDLQCVIAEGEVFPAPPAATATPK